MEPRARSSIVKTSINPQWNERFLVPVADKVTHIKVTIKDNNAFTAPAIGHAEIPVEEVAPGKQFDGWLDLRDDQEEIVVKKDPLRHKSAVRLPCAGRHALRMSVLYPAHTALCCQLSRVADSRQAPADLQAVLLQAQIHMRLCFSPVSSDPGWGNGLGTGPQMGSVPRIFFPMRHGCRIHLYNDAYQVRCC